ncbi:2-5 RNA ligase superfamily [uncultured virus]|nr:2-5 RNA ligase superfamily [uncultured virus]
MDTKSALTCLVPESSQIQDIRKQYDTAYNRWPPHFNIGAFPFLSFTDHERIAPLIQNICSKFFPIEIVLNDVDNFKVKGKKPGTLFAGVTDHSDLLERLYSEIASFLKINHQDFHPHVTLGRFNSQVTMESVQANLYWTPINFILTGLHWIVRDADTPFEIKYFFPFGENTFEKREDAMTIDDEDVMIIDEKDSNSDSKNSNHALTVSQFQNYYVYHLRELGQQARIKPKIMNILLIDNSGSMSGATVAATEIIGGGMFGMANDQIEMLPGTVILFSEQATILSSNITSSADIKKLRFPPQGQTNITAGIEMTMSCILSHQSASRDSNIHYIVTFLSDGQHNYGPEINDGMISKLRQQINEAKLQISIIVVGIISNDTRLGMKIKTGLETVTMNCLDSVYYARNTNEMSVTLQHLTKGCVESLCHGSITNLDVTGGLFLENMSNKLASFVQNKETMILVKKTGTYTPKLTIDGQNIKAELVGPDANDIHQVVDTLLPKMSQIKIAHGNASIKTQIENLEQFITISEQLFDTVKTSYDVNQIGKDRIKPQDRLNLIKKLKMTEGQFRQERNKLRLLKATVEDSSAKQAEFLTGINKKYGDKAVLRADTINITPQQVLTQITELRDKLKIGLEKDANGGKVEDQSLLSLNTPLEQVEEWIQIINEIQGREFNDIYSLLVCFGLAAYPVKFEHNNAVQMDPFQTYCLDIEPHLIDTSSLMLAQQLNHRLLSPSNKVITDCVVLIQPSASNSYCTAIRSPIYQYIASVTLCRDLYMYHPKMTFSMHAHSLLAAINKYYQTKSGAYLDLSLRILYSIRKFWGPTLCEKGDNVNLFNHWWKEWNTITQSEQDQCNHPVQLLLMLGACDLSLDKDLDEYTSPLIILLNEILARKLKIGLTRLYKPSDDSSRDIAVRLARNLLSITAENSPKPNLDIMIEEPTLITVREQCQHWADVDRDQFLNIGNKLGLSGDSIHDYVNETLMPYLQTFHFGLSLQKLLLETGSSWDQITQEIEAIGKIPEFLIDQLTPKLMEIKDKNIYDYLKLDDKHSQQVSKTMFLQGLLCHDSQSRHDINTKNVLDSVTLQDIIIDLRMSCYFDACKVKKQQWLQVIGNVTFERAFNGDETVYENMIGHHTHGLSHDQFWAMARVAKDNPLKKEIFLRKSNSTVPGCFNRIK